MKFKLNIYEKKKVVKTYETDAYDLMYGTLEDFLEIIDLDVLTDKMNDSDFIKLIAKIVAASVSKLKPLLTDVFEGLTEEELRNTKVKEVIAVILQIAMYSFTEINGIGTEKNA